MVDFTRTCREHAAAGMQGRSACRLEVGPVLLDYADWAVELPSARDQRAAGQAVTAAAGDALLVLCDGG